MKKLFKHCQQRFHNKAQDKAKPAADYFTMATRWADDIYTQSLASRARYQLACIGLTGLSVSLALAFLALFPLKKPVPFIVEHYAGGYVNIAPVNSDYSPQDQAEVESELVRYIINRESYIADAFAVQFELVNALSSDNVAQDYRDEQSVHNKLSPINVLGDAGSRQVHVESVVFLDDENTPKKPHETQAHHNLAEVNYTVTTQQDGHPSTQAYTALMSWVYTGTPASPVERWRNWDGFMVTQFTRNQRNLQEKTR
ncbi:MAG: hypothetical protein CMF50_03765 [Legionellales bacterium]|nr:hypothetical protein [Legionellales bacterium]|tara:strand:+ start:12571 stop:13338 length:768 start_codon:yes stop_codon:yes gene_type:complete